MGRGWKGYGTLSVVGLVLMVVVAPLLASQPDDRIQAFLKRKDNFKHARYCLVWERQLMWWWQLDRLVTVDAHLPATL